MQHSRWLDWKMKHGLACRGRPAPMNPQGTLAKLLYRLHYHKHDIEATPEGGPPQTFKQSVGGSIGPSGRVNT